MLSGLCSDLWILSCKNPIPCKSSFWKEAGSPAMKLSRRSPPSSLAVAIKFPLMPKCSRFNVSSRQALTRFSTNCERLRLIPLFIYSKLTHLIIYYNLSITKYTYFTYIEILQKLLTKDGFDFIASVIKTFLQFIFSHNGGHYTRNNLIEHFKMKRLLIFDLYMQL